MAREGGVTYRSVLRNREFAALLAAQSLSTTGDQLARIAIAVLVFGRTGSPFAASATYAMSYLTYLVGGPILTAISDRNPRVTVMVVCDVLRAPLILVLALDDLPLWSFFAVLGLVGVLAPPFDSARSALQPDLLLGEAYVVGNAIMSVSYQVSHVAGFLGGGALVSLVSVRGALGFDAATFLVSAGLMLLFVRHRASAQTDAHPGSLLNDVRSGLLLVRSTPVLRRLLTFALLGSAVIIAPEGLAIPVASALGGGALAAGVLTAAVPAGFLVASIAILRIPSESREGLLPRLVLLSCLPLLLTPWANDIAVVAGLWFVAGMGGCVNLIASASYVQACPREFRARAYGIAVTSLNLVQGTVLLVAGALADVTAAANAVALLAAALLLAVVVRATWARNSAQGKRVLVRSTQG